MLVCYLLVRDQLRGQVDSSLRAQQTVVERTGQLETSLPGIPASAGGPAPYVQIVLANGRRARTRVTSPGRSAIGWRSPAPEWLLDEDVYVGRTHLRVLAFSHMVTINGQPEAAAIQLARPLNGVDGILSNLRLVLVFVLVGGIALAWAMGRVAARRVLAPLSEVAQTAQHIGETDDLEQRIHVHADDEVGAAGSRFNSMLDRLEGSRAALDESVRAQRQLVADASHELRTPMTSLRTNIEVLLEGGELARRAPRLLTDVVEQCEELTALVTDLIELARGDEPGFATEDVRLDRVAAESVARSRRNAPEHPVAAQPGPDDPGRRPGGWSERSTTCSTTPPATRPPAARSTSPSTTGA